MKTTTFVIAVILAGGIVRAQTTPDWSWAFQWGPNRYGILFEDASLDTSVRCVVRDDLERIVSGPFLSPGATVSYSADNSAGGYTGHASLGGVFKGIPPDLMSVRYTEHMGINFFHVSPQLSQKYLEKIALTNAHAIQLASLGNFFHSVSNVFSGAINTQNRTELATKFWVASENRVWNVSDISEKSDAEIAELFAYRFLPASILDLEMRELYGATYLWCNARVAVDGSFSQFDRIPLVSVTNAWFFCNWW